jgi:hypothetical protein
MIIGEVDSLNENFISNFFTSCLKRRVQSLENEICQTRENLKSICI